MHRWHIQYLGCIELPSHLTELEMESFFTLSDEERQAGIQEAGLNLVYRTASPSR